MWPPRHNLPRPSRPKHGGAKNIVNWGVWTGRRPLRRYSGRAFRRFRWIRRCLRL